MRLTWVQPEDLVGHELRQAGQDGRDPDAVAAIAARWSAAGGHGAPPRAGASPEPRTPEERERNARLRRLAEDLLDELAALPSAYAADEPDDLDAILALAPAGADGGLPGPRNLTEGEVPRADRVLGAWLGRAAGCVLGKPVEKIPREGIREIAEATGNWPIRTWFTARGLPADIAERWPWNRRSAVNSLAENIDGTPEDDDLNFPLLALALLERHGAGFTTGDVAQMWLDELPGGRVFTAERVAYRNLLLGLTPPDTATWRNPFREWIGAQIRTDVYGWANPGDPVAAARLAHRDARLSHTANGIYGAMFAAAMCASALVAASVDEVVEAGLSVVPPRSRLAVAVRRAVEHARSEPDFEKVVDGLHARHGDLHWVHTINNAALVAAALVHARGDFTASIANAVAGGWDTDSDGATVGSVAGALIGAREIPAAWTAPLRHRLASSLTGFDGIGFEELAARTAALAAGGAS
ncbi:ADP-ribosylglycohydrolase family protein [Bailinhaonella thermotolerans]|uniref:ADP-ribosylglycohydrolase family protein n=1 Tax=Bailinhaonella thermotolerans TaxID=1070861 RepID=A0A3A4A2M0_9ACTN|nr:ADP-ribosylglycohydrolase family protein [Bailinhaonella thermotolerans]RJL22966.1 ADP-ribosylglycohydrolase family protein [Bailinhaonella thermotolerans]